MQQAVQLIPEAVIMLIPHNGFELEILDRGSEYSQ